MNNQTIQTLLEKITTSIQTISNQEKLDYKKAYYDLMALFVILFALLLGNLQQNK